MTKLYIPAHRRTVDRAQFLFILTCFIFTCYGLAPHTHTCGLVSSCISPPRFLAKCRKRRQNNTELSIFSRIFSYSFIPAGVSQAISCEDRLRNDLNCLGLIVDEM